jgi:ubiquinone/menaquinone biosynthesis C-methylase UbiE
MSSAPVDTADRIAYLDQVAATAPGRDYKGRLLAALGMRFGHTVVDVGCGPGTDLADLAAAVGVEGAVIGVDRDPGMAAEAGRRVADLARVEVRVGDAHALPLPDGSVDRARADRVLQHLAQPAQAVSELRRVVRPGGLVALAEPDWDTLVVDDRDVETSRAYTRFVVEHVVRNAAIGRQLARLMVEAGLQVRRLEATPVIFREFEAAETVLRLRSVCERAWRAGAFAEASGRAWLGRMERGPFLASFLLFTTVGSTQPVSV